MRASHCGYVGHLPENVSIPVTEVQPQPVCGPRERLQAIRILRGYPTLPSMARVTGLSETTIQRIEKSGKHVNPSNIVRYAMCLGIEQVEVDKLRRGKLRLELKFVKLEGGQ